MSDNAEISRQNGAKSRGPVTARGKRRSSRNATRHGLLSRSLVLCNESARRFNQTVSTLVDRLQPADDLERAFVEEMAASLWRMRRTWAIETAILDRAIDDDEDCPEPQRIAKAFSSLADTGKAIHLVHRYEIQFQRTCERALRNLRGLRQGKNFQTNPAQNPIQPAQDQ